MWDCNVFFQGTKLYPNRIQQVQLQVEVEEASKNSKIVFGDCSVFYSDLLKEIPQLRYSHEMCPSVVFFSKPSEYIPQL